MNNNYKEIYESKSFYAFLKGYEDTIALIKKVDFRGYSDIISCIKWLEKNCDQRKFIEYKDLLEKAWIEKINIKNSEEIVNFKFLSNSDKDKFINIAKFIFGLKVCNMDINDWNDLRFEINYASIAGLDVKEESIAPIFKEIIENLPSDGKTKYWFYTKTKYMEIGDMSFDSHVDYYLCKDKQGKLNVCIEDRDRKKPKMKVINK